MPVRARRSRLDAGRERLYCPPAKPRIEPLPGARKRTTRPSKGSAKARHSQTSHILEKKSPKRKRRLSNDFVLSSHDEPRVKVLLGAKKK